MNGAGWQGFQMCGDSGQSDPIPDDREIWRRISPEWVVYDKNLGDHRVSSQAFQNQVGYDRLSVLDSKIVLDSSRSPKDVLAQYPGYSLASLTTGFARSKGQSVVPAPEEDEPAHAHVIGDKPRSVRSAFAKEAKWVIRATL